MGVSVPGRAAAGAQHLLTVHRLPRAPVAPHPAGLGGRKQLRTIYREFWVHGSSGRSVGKRCSCCGGTRCLSFMGHALRQNKQNRPWLSMEAAWWIADALLHEAVVAQGPWGC